VDPVFGASRPRNRMHSSLKGLPFGKAFRLSATALRRRRPASPEAFPNRLRSVRPWRYFQVSQSDLALARNEGSLRTKLVYLHTRDA
jgi:hypothetical protein